MPRGMRVSWKPRNSIRLFGNLVGFTADGVARVQRFAQVHEVLFRDLTYEE
jgi:hypothetical protein